MRLTNAIKEGIITGLCDEAVLDLQKSLKILEKEREEIGAKLGDYLMYFHHQKRMLRSPSTVDFIISNPNLFFNITSIGVKLPGPKNRTWIRTSNLYGGPSDRDQLEYLDIDQDMDMDTSLILKALANKEEREKTNEAIAEKKRAINRTMKGFLKGFTTVKKLLESMPEMGKYISETSKPPDTALIESVDSVRRFLCMQHSINLSLPKN